MGTEERHRISKKTYDILFVLGVVFLFSFLFRNLLTLGEWQYDNFFEPVPTTSSTYYHLLSAWSFSSTGFRQPEWGYLYQWLAAAISPITGVAGLQKLVILIPLPVAAFSMFVFLGDIVDNRGWRYLISVSYSVSPYFVVDFLSGSDFAFIAGMLFPLLMLSTMRFIRNGSIKNLISMAAITAVVGGLSPPPVFWYLFFVFALLVSTWLANLWCSVKRVVLGILLASGIVVLLSLPLFAASTISLFESNENLLSSGYSFTDMASHIFQFYLAFAGPRDAIVFGLITGVLFLLRPIPKDAVRRAYYNAALFVALPLTLFLMSIEIIQWVPNYYVSIVAFYGFEYPHYLMDLLMWSYFVAAGVLVGELLRGGSKLGTQHSHGVFKVLSSLGIIIIILTLPTFTTAFQPNSPYTPYNGYDFFNGISFASYQVPSSFPNALSLLRQNLSQSRVLWLPQIPTYYEDSLTSYMPSSLNLAYRSTNALADQQVSGIFSQLLSNSTEELGFLLRPWAVKYVVVDLTVANKTGGWGEGAPRLAYGSFLVGGPNNYINVLGHQRDLKQVFKNGSIIVFENLDYLPEVSVFQQLYIVDTKSAITSDTYKLLGFNPNNTLLISKNEIPNDLLSQYSAISSGEINESDPSQHPFVSTSPAIVVQTGPTSFDVRTTASEGHLIVILSESYDSAWRASAQGGDLTHIPLPPYHTNLFYLNGTSTQGITIAYNYQIYITSSFAASYLGWIGISGFAIYFLIRALSGRYERWNRMAIKSQFRRKVSDFEYI